MLMRTVLLLVMALSIAYSQPPSPAPPKPTDEKKSQISKDQSSTTVVSSPDPRTTPQNSHQESPTNWWMVIFTGALVICSFLQWLSMRGMLKENARSANIATQTFIASHRPRLTLRFVSANNKYGGFIPVSGGFEIFNAGDTEAAIDAEWFEIVIGAHLPSTSPYEGKHGKAFQWKLGPGNSVKIGWPTHSTPEIQTEQYMGLGNHRDFVREHRKRPEDGTDLFLVGWIRYRSGGELRQTGFCQRYNFLTERFERYQDQDYEYGDQG